MRGGTGVLVRTSSEVPRRTSQGPMSPSTLSGRSRVRGSSLTSSDRPWRETLNWDCSFHPLEVARVWKSLASQAAFLMCFERSKTLRKGLLLLPNHSSPHLGSTGQLSDDICDPRSLSREGTGHQMGSQWWYRKSTERGYQVCHVGGEQLEVLGQVLQMGFVTPQVRSLLLQRNTDVGRVC